MLVHTVPSELYVVYGPACEAGAMAAASLLGCSTAQMAVLPYLVRPAPMRGCHAAVPCGA
jgi:hypothetical protein